MIADTSGLLALFDASDDQHDAVRDVVERQRQPFVVSPFVVAELDYLLATRVSIDAELAALRELSGGAYDLAEFAVDDLQAATAIIERYRDQDIGVADASLVVLAARHRTRAILTLDHRHFDVLRPLDGGRFRILP